MDMEVISTKTLIRNRCVCKRTKTKGNVIPIRMDCHDFENMWFGDIKFLHIDACHDYKSVITTISSTYD